MYKTTSLRIALNYALLVLTSISSNGANAQQLSTAMTKITPFQLDVRSRFVSTSQEQASIDLQHFTEVHISNYIQSNEDAVWASFQSISLDVEEKDMDSAVRNRHMLRQEQRRGQETVNFQVLYSGTISFLDAITTPTTAQIESTILNAFVGQGKIDFLRLIQSSTDEFLSSTYYLKVWLPSSQTGNAIFLSSYNSTFLIVAIVASIAIALTLIIASYYIFCNKKSTNHRRGKSTKQSRTSTRTPDLELVPTRSMSPSQQRQQQPEPFTKSYYPKSSLRQDRTSSRRSKQQHKRTANTNQDRSIMSKETIDVNGSFDMIAWKNNCTNTNTPFDADITMITNASHKTVEVQIPREIGGRNSISNDGSDGRLSSLSHGVLNEHNQRYSRHHSSSRRSNNTRSSSTR